MARKKKRTKRSRNRRKPDRRLGALLALFISMVSIFLLIALTSYFYTWKEDQDQVMEFSWSLLFAKEISVDNWLGRFGAVVSHHLFYRGIGVSSFLLPFYGMGLAMIIFFKRHWLQAIRLTTYLSISFLIFPLTFEFLFHSSAFPWGGVMGSALYNFLISFIGFVGTAILILFGYLALIYWHNAYLPQIRKTFQFQWDSIRKRQQKLVDTFLSGEVFQTADDIKEEEDVNGEEEVVVKPESISSGQETKNLQAGIEFETALDPDQRKQNQHEKSETPGEERTSLELEMDERSYNPIPPAVTIQPSQERDGMVDEDRRLVVEREDKTTLLEPYDPTRELSQYRTPVLDLLDNYMMDQVHINRLELETNKDQIITTLQNYKIEITKIRATVGPIVTLYEIVPDAGIRISKIKNLEDDIALSLSALGIRIIAPIPGKGTIGIEVPNSKPTIVSMRSVIASSKFQNAKMDLPIAFGKTVENETFVADLAKMLHLLMAGATGQGKSVGLNAIITSLLYKKHPTELKFVLVDPKKVELTLYSKIERHYLAKLPDSEEAIITDNTKVINTLNSLCIEMDDRYELLKNAFVRNIKEYNEKFKKRKLNPEKGHRYLPYIVLVVDEFADLIMTAGKEVETPIARLAQLARAVGIHLIIATQRPSVNVITGIIKANFPARVAFRVTSKIDSRTILDSAGADQLIGKGDMLFTIGNELVRMQCAFVDTPEVDEITEYIGSQQGFPDALLLPEYEGSDADSALDIDLSERDALFEDAARVIVMAQQGSASLLQRKLRLGYNRAGRIIDQLEAAGIVGPFEGSKARQVLVQDEDSLEQLLDSLK